VIEMASLRMMAYKGGFVCLFSIGYLVSHVLLHGLDLTLARTVGYYIFFSISFHSIYLLGQLFFSINKFEKYLL